MPEMTTFLGLDSGDEAVARAGVVILPVPYERTSSYVQGSSLGPRAILDASFQLEEYDEEVGAEIFHLCNGIATLNPVPLASEVGAAAVTKIQRSVGKWLDQGKFVVCLGGEHTSSLGPMKAHHARYGERMSVLHLDAHRDLRDSYLGDPFSHASVMARALEFLPSLVQVGIRSHSEAELAADRTGKVTAFYAQPILTGGMPDWQDRVLAALSDKVYMSIDADFFDPTVIPSVGTPEPGGFLWYDTLTFLKRVCTEKTLVGFDVSEFAPIPGLHHPDFTLARLIYKLIGYACLPG